MGVGPKIGLNRKKKVGNLFDPV